MLMENLINIQYFAYVYAKTWFCKSLVHIIIIKYERMLQEFLMHRVGSKVV